MIHFDASQQRVLSLTPSEHARVLGAPGSGKTTLLVESFAQLSTLPGWCEGEVLAFAPNRLVATALRQRIEGRLHTARSGVPARSFPSFAFALLQRHAALRGTAAPRLLTGTAHDEAIESVIAQTLDHGSSQAALPLLPKEVMRSAAFRGELREIDRVLDDFLLTPAALSKMLTRDTHLGQAEPLRAQWELALQLLETVRKQLARQRPDEFTASSMLRLAGETIRHSDDIPVPRLVLVDDAGDYGEGALALLAALAERGTHVWVFGDPDIATGAFHGERAPLLAGVCAALARRSNTPSLGQARHAAAIVADAEQLVVLDTVHRHGPKLRSLVRSLTGRIGAAGAGEQRQALSCPSCATAQPTAPTVSPDTASHGASDSVVSGSFRRDTTTFAKASTEAEQLSAVAYRLRAAHLGLAADHGLPPGAPLDWARMAVICRSRDEVDRVRSKLASEQIPTGVTSGGIVLREFQLVRELIRLLQHTLGFAPFAASDVSELLGGVLGGLDTIALRRLRAALHLHAVRTAQQATATPNDHAATQTEPQPSAAPPERPAPPRGVDELLLEGFLFPGTQPLLDLRGARRLMRLGAIAAAAKAVHNAGGTPREVLWCIWQESRLADPLRQLASGQSGASADEAHRTLDAVVALFFALQRHEEQDSDRPIAAVLEELLSATVPEDSLAAQSQRDAVTVTTPQGAIGREFDLVCVLSLQDGSWPNLRSRGSLLGVTALERWLRGEAAEPPTRRDTLHDELRLFTHAVARARTEVVVLAVSNEHTHPSPFFALGASAALNASPQQAGEAQLKLAAEATSAQLASTRLTLRGVVAEMRRRLVRHPNDSEALEALVALARAKVHGAHPDEWYGVLPLSSEAPLVNLADGSEARVLVHPSEVERAESCPLDWFLTRLGGRSRPHYQAGIGTLLHRALESAQPGVTAAELFDMVRAEWSSLRFEAHWQSRRALTEAEQMAAALAQYLADCKRLGRRLLATEISFELPLAYATISGTADRIEARPLEAGGFALTVVDLKTGRRAPTATEIAQHAQLQAYQLGVLRGAFNTVAIGSDAGPPESSVPGGATLLYLHPDAIGASRKKHGERYREISQPELTESEQSAVIERVLHVAQVMAGAHFEAQLEHHCAQPHTPDKACALQLIPAVSYG